MSKKYTERARKVMELANEQARKMNHEFIGTEHVLLGLVEEGSGVGANVLKGLGVGLPVVRSQVQRLVKPGSEPVAEGKLPKTPPLKEMLKYATEEAESLNHNYIGTEHLLLGFLRERDGVAAQVLSNLGVNPEDVREELRSLPGRGAIGEQLRFWRTLAGGLSRGQTFISTLTKAREELSGTAFESITEQLIREVNDGKTLSEAMKKFESAFTPVVCALVRAGEVGGVMDVIAQRIVEGLKGGTLGPGAGGPGGDAERYWRTLALLLSSGVPILDMLDMLPAAVGSAELAGATLAIRNSVRDGGTMAEAMRTFPEVFAPEVIGAVDLGEKEGELDREAVRIADALAAGDVTALARDPLGYAEQRAQEVSQTVRYVNKILLDAIKANATDIHIDSTEDGAGRLRVRTDGVLQDRPKPGKEVLPRLINRIKLMAGMDIAQHSMPQDGRIMLKINDKDLDVRVSVVPTVHGERLVLRVLRREGIILGLDQLGLEGDGLVMVRRLCHLPNGIVIANGPTGCGKTTLVYSMLMELRQPEIAIITVEDPVEYSFDGIAQIQIRPEIGLTFAHAIRHCFRQAPNIIMVGEIRDLEVLNLCNQCALTGHLVLTTLNANTSPGAVQRLLDMGLPPFLVSASLGGVISLRLIRLLCPQCKEPAEPPLLHSLPPEAVEFVASRKDAQFCKPKGCEICGGRGYKGRTGIFEILVMDHRLRQLVTDGAGIAALRSAAKEAGMRTMLMDGLEKAAQGITTIEEVLAVAPLDTST